MAPTTPRTGSATPDAVTSPIAADLLAAALDDYADTIRPTTRTAAGQARMLRRTARQFRDLHDLDEPALDAEIVPDPHGGDTYGGGE